MSQPTFLSDGHTPRRGSAMLEITEKVVGNAQDHAAAPLAVNDPQPQDTILTLNQKWLGAITNLPNAYVSND